MDSVESQIAEWRAYVARAPGINGRDVDELEDHLLPPDRRAERGRPRGRRGVPDRREAARRRRRPVPRVRPRAQRPALEAAPRRRRRRAGATGRPTGWLEALAFAVAAAAAIQVACRAAGFPDDEPSWLLRNVGVLVLPFLAGYFARRRQLDLRQWLLAAAPFGVAALLDQPLPVGCGLGHRGPRRAPPARRAVVRRRPPRTWAARPARTSGAWTSSASPASGSSTTC